MKKLLLVAALMLPAIVARAETEAARVAAASEEVIATATDNAVTDQSINCSDGLGVTRVAEVDTAGGGEYGEQYRPTPLLQDKEVVLTFDDGPHPVHTREILDALAAECTKATFFYVGRMLKNFPEIAKQVQAEGHTVGTHTYSHRNLGATSLGSAEQQIESTFNIADEVLPDGVAPFFRFPYLSDPKRVRDYLAKRNIAVFGIDVDSWDWRVRSPEMVIRNVLTGLDRKGKGIILFHDIQARTAAAMPTLLAELKKRGYKVVHIVPKSKLEAVAAVEPASPTPRKRARQRKTANH
ncbi:polysaccharide deacetylase family protein [Hyphomicrobium sp. D-2]|uniref:polysaccharide deacetylase family protein n=1 Tax=Hyphomicrobium sp. D-2 TaxID=3041621 RepID=UPI0024550D16|nr:polysaccharide deacetylase family protein [Hyphomicrobium sp. D-2]MDH4982087.1 polysaccharide deacetylase family protein [Hyphomicrobium sp. D-2]